MVSGGPLVIVGDALLDRDVRGHAGRLCPDAPAPVVEAPPGRERPGGAALAALLASNCDGAELPGIVLVAPFGTEPASQTVRGLLPAAVRVVPLPLTGALQEKTRIMAGDSTLLRLDTLAPVPVIGQAGRAAADAIGGAGALLVSDYGQGTTASRVIRTALAARGRQVPLVWDPHPRGTRPVPGTLLATPNEAEAAAAAGRSRGGGFRLRDAAAAADRLLARWPAQAIAVTRGAHGALLARREQAPLAIPAPPASHGDPCGAGDMFAVAAATALAGGALMSEAVTWAVEAASRYVAAGGARRLGRAAGRASGAAARAGSGREAVADGRVDGARPGPPPGGVLVAAGGCFDVLHAGHVSMLKAARALGDTLVVCINSDASVRRLKGPGRPLNTAADRAAVLRALDCVDGVLIFEEDTPEHVLSELRPDIWVKGGDYDGRELPEEAVLRRWGGMAVTVPYLDGRSTTRIAAAAVLAARQHG